MGDDGEAEENCGIAIEGVGGGGGEINPAAAAVAAAAAAAAACAGVGKSSGNDGKKLDAGLSMKKGGGCMT